LQKTLLRPQLGFTKLDYQKKNDMKERLQVQNILEDTAVIEKVE
jgi:hypothetical protein